MAEFMSGLLWGAGISLGICVGLVVWAIVKEIIERACGITSARDNYRQTTRKTLAAMAERNGLARDTNDLLLRIADVIAPTEQHG